MSTTVRQVMKYLSEYPDDAKLGVMVADTKNRKKYQIKDGNWLDMFSYPVLVLDVGEDICAIKRGNYKEYLCNYCPKCGQRFNWEEVELDEA